LKKPRGGPEKERKDFRKGQYRLSDQCGEQEEEGQGGGRMAHVNKGRILPFHEPADRPAGIVEEKKNKTG